MAQPDAGIGATPNKALAGVFGAVYVLVGLLGFAVTGGVGFAATDSDTLLLGIFELNPLHNLVHLAIGATLLGAAKAGEYASRGVNLAVGGTYLLVGVLGLFILGSEANILSLNVADNALHFGSAAVLLGVALTRGTSRAVATTARTRVDA